MSKLLIKSFARGIIEKGLLVVSVVMSTTETLAHRYVTTNARGRISLMFRHMRTVIRDKFEILYPIVGLITVYMMDNFRRTKIPTNRFLHYKTVFSNITKCITKWVFFVANQLVSILVVIVSSFPKGRIATSHDFLLKLIPAFFGTCFSSSLSKFPGHYFKRITADLANYFTVVHIQTSYRTLGKLAT